ncbi:ABC transporter ATP-binding protein [Pseudonocardia sp.]|uniref:ABC transporter ATP-binding protein n=1 Tax=Pseudonocardia sp. TaxID=60912 RepID=UPI003D11E1E0
MTLTATRVETGLRVTGLCRSFGPVPVLRGVDLVVPEGGLTAVLGPSGCGKTTLLRLIAGFDRPDAGTIEIAGRPTSGPAERRGIGYVTQEGNLFPHLTVARNITFGLPRRERRANARVAELLEFVGLDVGFATRRPHELSGGQQQRVALARALAPQPRIVLLDEPFSALDAELRAGTGRAVADALAATATTTVLVTHDQDDALRLASRVAVMRDGVIVQEDTPTGLYRNPADRGVAAFVGDVVVLPATARGGVAECALGRVGLVAAADGPGTVLLRPEQIALDGGPDGVVAHVRHADFHGHDAVVRLQVPLIGEVTARCPGHQLPAVDDQVRVSLRGTATFERA